MKVSDRSLQQRHKWQMKIEDFDISTFQHFDISISTFSHFHIFTFSHWQISRFRISTFRQFDISRVRISRVRECVQVGATSVPALARERVTHADTLARHRVVGAKSLPSTPQHRNIVVDDTTTHRQRKRYRQNGSVARQMHPDQARTTARKNKQKKKGNETNIRIIACTAIAAGSCNQRSEVFTARHKQKQQHEFATTCFNICCAPFFPLQNRACVSVPHQNIMPWRGKVIPWNVRCENAASGVTTFARKSCIGSSNENDPPANKRSKADSGAMFVPLQPETCAYHDYSARGIQQLQGER